MDVRRKVSLGRSGVEVTELGLGAAPIGNLYSEVSDTGAAETISGAHALGLRFIDTAPFYGKGLSERRVGRALAELDDDDVVLSTKVGRLLRPGPEPDPGDFFNGRPFFPGAPQLNSVRDYSYDGTMRSFEESLERLGLDRVDVLFIHDPDDWYEEALSGAYVALDELRSQGVIRAVGVGMNQAEMLLRFACEADFDCFLLAGRYTLLDQVGFELLEECRSRGIAILAGGVYNSGILARPEPGATFDYLPAPPEVLERAERLRSVCDRYGIPLMSAAIQFPFAHPAVASVVIGARSLQEIEQNVRMAHQPIPADLWTELKDEGLLPEVVPVPPSQEVAVSSAD